MIYAMDKSLKIDNKGKAILFKNPFLEKLTKTRPWVIYILYIPLNLFCLYLAHWHFKIGTIPLVCLFILAFFSWTLVEYFAHRYLFHYQASSTFGKRMVYLFHENHHEFPRDTDRLFMPPAPSLIIAGLVFGFFSLLSYSFTGTIAYALIYFSGFVFGYLSYVSMHYAIHAYAPPRQLKFLWRNHHLHHYKYPDKAFGVSSSFWDRVFGTLPNEKTDKRAS
jgi:sterol desaturase/sphingolipid hydroxylase (fatty acid hydroxylase superfamily)